MKTITFLYFSASAIWNQTCFKTTDKTTLGGENAIVQFATFIFLCFVTIAHNFFSLRGPIIAELW